MEMPLYRTQKKLVGNIVDISGDIRRWKHPSRSISLSRVDGEVQEKFFTEKIVEVLESKRSFMRSICKSARFYFIFKFLVITFLAFKS